MIISRTPLYDNNRIVGYYDYGACLYPLGQTGSNLYFFNQENIREICFQGYIDENEMEYRKKYDEQIKKVTYPKLTID